jgi:hypothetical protein
MAPLTCLSCNYEERSGIFLLLEIAITGSPEAYILLPAKDEVNGVAGVFMNYTYLGT